MAFPFAKDDDLFFPHFMLLKASAGSGKTHALTLRIVQFLLSGKIPDNRLKNVLAITFSNHAAKEMKQRTLRWLKDLSLGKQDKTAEIGQILSLSAEEIRSKATRLLDDIFSHFDDFQVKTIDSFMAVIFRASAMDFGFYDDFEIVLDNRRLMRNAFNQFLRKVRKGTPEAAALCAIVDSGMEFRGDQRAFPWLPSELLFDETVQVYRKITGEAREVLDKGPDEQIEELKEQVIALVHRLEDEVESSGLGRNRKSAYSSAKAAVRSGRLPDLAGISFAAAPVNKPPAANRNGGVQYGRIVALWSEFRKAAGKLTAVYCRLKTAPSIDAYRLFTRDMEEIKLQSGQIFIEEINRRLADTLAADTVPDVYFRLGERISHFLIDEFQDTSPVQWKNLFPLIENALSQGGSFFAVGDTKQSIYGFRNADFRIMKSLECSNPFPSARFVTGELDLNYRSRPAILDFTERIFKVNLKSYSDLHTAGEMSGLTSFHQKALSEREGQGIVESALIEKRPGTAAEREWVYSRIERLRSKGFRYREMALLTQTNEQSVQAAAWLSETGIPFISYSSLDIRRRKSIRELLALIRFLINPMDHFALSAFLLGDIFSAFLREGAPDNPPERIRKFLLDERDRFPLYKRFQEEFGNLWETCFESLFKVAGFLPLYDLTSEIYAVFSVFSRFPEEEAALIKFLEVIRKFEWRGSGQSGEFLIQAEEDEAGSEEWNLSVPRDLESVHVMTVHKAKGLEFPAVILLLYETKNRGFDYIVEEAGKGIRLLRINRNESRCDPGLHELYEAEKIREWVNRLNALYVGLTRPAKELHVLGVANRKEAFPFNIIPEVTPAERDFVRPVPESRENFGSISARPVQHRSRRLAIPFQKVDEHSLSERKRGEFLHAVIGQIEYLNGNGESQLQESVDRLIRAGEPPRGTDRLVKLLARFLNRPDVSGYFAPRPGRRIYREMELLDSKGQLYRPDRVIVDAESVTVIDFKSGKGGKKAGPAGEQVRNYLTLVRDIFPGKPARGLVASIDLNHVEEVT